MEQPNLSFNFVVFPYNTVVSAYDRTTHLNVNISNSGNHVTTGLNNPYFNMPIPVDSVSGSGSFCQGTPGLPVTLSNSQADIKYQLKKGGVNDGGEVAGSGTSLTWINRTTGIYTVSGRRTATYQIDGMTGTAIVTMDNATVGGGVTGGTTITLGSPTDTLRLQGQLGTIVMWQKQINSGGYSNIPSTAGLTVYQEIPSLAGTWDYRTLVQNGVCLQEGSTPATVVVSATPLTRSWIGVVDEKWNKAGNWSPSGVPGAQDDILIPASVPFMPVVKGQGLNCNNIIVRPGAVLTINPGFVLTVNGTITIEP